MPLSSQPHTRRTLKQVADTISAFNMIHSDDRVLVGVSGGPDSVALLHILHELAEGLNIPLAAGHLNHGLRGRSSERDARFAQAVAEGLDIPFFFEKCDVRQYSRQRRLSLEEAARDVRYAFLKKIARNEGYHRIALGHHADDNAEQILMHLFRGSGPLGMSGIPPVRGDMIVRPLIRLEKDHILGFLKENRIQWMVDESNQDPVHLRNRIRHDVIPGIRATIQPKLTDTLTRMAHITQTEEQWLKQVVEPIFEASILKRQPDTLVLSADRLENMHPALQRRVIRRAILAVKGTLRRITFAHIEAGRGFLKHDGRHRSAHLPDRIQITRTGATLSVSRAGHPLRKAPGTGRPAVGYRIDAPDIDAVYIKETGAKITFSKIPNPGESRVRNTGHHAAFFDIRKVSFPLLLREVRPGDRFTPIGMSGTQKVSDFFINSKIPREDRRKYPLLVSNGNIIWVVGLRIDDAVKITPETNTVLKAEMSLPVEV